MKSFVNLTQVISEVTSKGVNSTVNINRLKSEIQAMQFTPDAGGGGGTTYGAYVTAYIARLTVLGYTIPSATVLAAMDAMFTTIGNTTMAKLDVFWLFALNNAALQDAASINIINPSLYQSSYVNSPTYGIKGIAGNGTTSYVDTNFNAFTNGVNYTLNSASKLFYLETVPTVGTNMEGTITSLRNQMVYSASTAIVRANAGINNLSSNVDTTGIEYKAIDRQDSTNVSVYNGTTKSDRTQTSVSVQNEKQTLGKVAANFSNGEFGFYAMGSSLSQTEHNTIRSAYITYRTTIGLP